MPELGRISAVVCNYNGMAYLERCVGALVEEGDVFDEILVVDNDSTDGGVEFLRETYPTVKILEMGTNNGPTDARNAGYRAARNRWVLTLDNDAFVTPGMVAKLVEAAASEDAEGRRATVIQPRSVFTADRERVHYDGGSLHYAGLICLRNFYRPLAEAEGERVAEVDVAIAVCLLVDAQSILEIGGYDETYFFWFEDLDLSMRLRRMGHRFVSVADAIVLHDEGTQGLSSRDGSEYPDRRVYYHSRNRWLYLLRTYRLRTLLLASPGLCVYEVFWLAFALKQGALGSWFGGKMSFMKLLPESFAKNRALSKVAVVNDRKLLMGGPLTVTPGAAQKGFMKAVVGVLDKILRAWWGLARHIPL
ncbi:MAG: glycosyltransferase family 2 protein [Planctomycetota bacterium]|nr:glycosyltransferase family 2 protein [Planctomycetota bacterium]